MGHMTNAEFLKQVIDCPNTRVQLLWNGLLKAKSVLKGRGKNTKAVATRIEFEADTENITPNDLIDLSKAKKVPYILWIERADVDRIMAGKEKG